MNPKKNKPMQQTQPAPAEVDALIALYNKGLYAELESRARTLVEQFPNFGFGWKLLGGALQMQRKNALPAFQKTAQLMPGEADAHYNLAVALKSLGRLDDAAASYRRALKVKPDYAEAHSNLGNVLKDLGRLDDAVTCYRRALALKPDSADAHNNLGTVLKDLGRLDDAVTCYRRALALRPDYADAHYNLGNALKDLGQLDDAVASYRQAIEVKPDFADAYNNLGTALKDLGRTEAALASYRRLLELKPDFAEAHNNLGVALKDLGQLDAALASYRRAVELKPDYAEAHNNLGNVLKDMGRHEDALASYRGALEFKPDLAEARSNLLFSLNYTANHDSSYCLAEAREYGRMVDEKVKSPFSTWQCLEMPERLRVGLISGDLCNHPVSYALKSLLEQLDFTRIELIAYPTVHRVDEFTAQIKPYFASWKKLYNLSDEAAARLIHSDGVHVLLDLSGHTAHNRLPVFAWKPAPVQTSWLGYFATTGMAEMNYLLTSEVAVPEVHKGQFTETVWYLPDTWLCFTAPDVDLPVECLPALNNGYITFGCFQRLDKVGNEVLTVWAKIFIALPSARLNMACRQLGDPAQAAQFVERLLAHGIDPARVTMRGSAMSREEYLVRYSEADVMLDSFPYPGVTTTCEALWMGVPTLTLAGDTLLARQGAGVLTAAGLGDWITTSVAEYVDKAVELASELPKLATLRAGLREQVSASPLFDAKRFARNFEDALWRMWRARTRDDIPKTNDLLTDSRA
jgi:protein O-GlcNAc transferase